MNEDTLGSFKTVLDFAKEQDAPNESLLDFLTTVVKALEEEPVKFVPTLGEIAEFLKILKEYGVHRGSVLYCVDRVWWEQEQIDEAGR